MGIDKRRGNLISAFGGCSPKKRKPRASVPGPSITPIPIVLDGGLTFYGGFMTAEKLQIRLEMWADLYVLAKMHRLPELAEWAERKVAATFATAEALGIDLMVMPNA